MQCDICKTRLKKGMKFCYVCGSKIIKEASRCTYCNAKLKKEMEFCYSCGKKVKDGISYKKDGDELLKNISLMKKLSNIIFDFFEDDNDEPEDDSIELSIPNRWIVILFLTIFILIGVYWYFSADKEPSVISMYKSIPCLYYDPKSNDAFLSIPEEVFVRESTEKGKLIDILITFKEEVSEDKLKTIFENGSEVDILYNEQIPSGFPEEYKVEVHASLKVKKEGNRWKSEIFKLNKLKGAVYYVQFGADQFPFGNFVGINIVEKSY